MLHQLPTELSVSIIETAAHKSRFSDRQSVFNLSMCSRTIYSIVSPILHQILIVTDDNVDRLMVLASNADTMPLAERILSHVCFFYNSSREDHPFDPRLLVNIESVETNLTFLMALTQPCLKRLYISYSYTLETTSYMVPEKLRTVTHMSGLLPMFRNGDWYNFLTDPAGWMRSLLEKVPAITHLGLAQEYPWTTNYKNTILTLDYEVVGTAIRTALHDRPQLQSIVIRTCGLPAQKRRTDIETVLRSICDPRVKLWFDLRPQEGWDDYLALRIRDIQEGRSLWTEARSL